MSICIKKEKEGYIRICLYIHKIFPKTQNNGCLRRRKLSSWGTEVGNRFLPSELCTIKYINYFLKISKILLSTQVQVKGD